MAQGFTRGLVFPPFCPDLLRSAADPPPQVAGFRAKPRNATSRLGEALGPRAEISETCSSHPFMAERSYLVNIYFVL